MNLNRLITVLKFKQKQNSTYFIIKDKIDIANVDITLYKGGMLLYTLLPTDNDNEVFMSILYKTKPLDSSISYENIVEEGLIKLTYENLASLLITEKIDAFYTDRNKKDEEIYRLLKESDGDVSGKSNRNAS